MLSWICYSGYHPWFSHWISLNSNTNLSKSDHYRTLFLGRSIKDSTDPEDSEKKNQIFEEMLPYLPDPVPLDELLNALRQKFEEHPDAMLGEVGLDRSARVPINYLAEQRKLSPFTIPFDHQLAILEAQLSLAVAMRRNVSLHRYREQSSLALLLLIEVFSSVKSQKATVDLLNKMKDKFGRKWTNISVDLHSCGLSPETWQEIEVITIFLLVKFLVA